MFKIMDGRAAVKVTVSGRKLAIALATTALCAVGLATSPSAALADPAPYAWQTVPFGAGGYVDGFAYHPREKDILYARTDIGGLYRFDYREKRWIPLLDHLGRQDGDLMGVLSIALDPANPDKVYAACGLYLSQWSRKGAILRSDDRGRTWKVSELPVHVGGNADGRGSGERLMVDPHNSAIVYFGSNQDGLWKSADGGQNFSRTPASVKAFSLVAVDPVDSASIWAGSPDGKGGLLLSMDGGQSFAPVNGLPAMVPQHVAFAPDGSMFVTFAQGEGQSALNPSNAKSGAVWKRDGRSGKWRDVTPKGPLPNLAGGFSGVDVKRDGTVAVSTIDRWYPGDDIFVSKDGGDHWNGLSERARHVPAGYPRLVNYLKGEERMGHWISDVKFNPFNPDEMIYGTGYGLWMSRNLASAKSGETVDFDFAVRNLEETATLQMASPTGGASLLVAMGDVAGAAWDDLARSPSAGLFTPSNESSLSVDFAGLKPGLIVRTTANSPTHGYFSRDGGGSWDPFKATPFRPLAKDEEWRGPGSVAISANATSLVWAPEKDNAFHSRDGGKTWQPSSGLPVGKDVSFLPVADKAADGIFYVFDKASARIFASGDGGASFNPLVEGLPKLEPWQNARLAVVPDRIRDLWLAAPYGLFHSPDSRSKMTQVAGVDEAWLVSFGAPAVKGAYPAVFLWGKVRGGEGLWRSDDQAASWTRINDDVHRFGELRAMSGDMLDPDTVYVAPHGRGVMVGMPAGKPLPVPGAASVAAGPAPRRISIDIKAATEPLDRFYDLSVGSDYTGTLMRPANMAQLKTTVDELGFRYVRFHDVFHDIMGTVRKVHGKTVYDWTGLDKVFDDLKARNIRPFVELGFTPDVMKSSNQTIFYWKGNTSHPKPDEWKALVDAFVRHVQARYGRNEVRNWFFEVWNEPNLDGFWEKADQKAYFDLYVLTANTIKAIDSELRVGGPSTAGAAWVPELLDYVAAKGSRIDFVSTHTYGVNGGFLDEMGKEDTKLDPSPMSITHDVLRVRQQIANSKFPTLPLYFTEWSTSYTPRDLVHDSYVSAPYILSKLKAVEGSVQAMSYWVHSDLFEEPGPPSTAFHGGFGLMTKDGVRKPAWFTYKYLHALKGSKVPVNDQQAWVASDGKEVSAVIWDFQQPVQPTSNRSFYGKLVPNAPSRDAALKISSLAPGGRYRVTVNRVGYKANDAYSAYIEMGKPDQLSREQLQRLHDLTQDRPESDQVVQADGSGKITPIVKMNSNDVVLVRIAPVN